EASHNRLADVAARVGEAAAAAGNRPDIDIRLCLASALAVADAVVTATSQTGALGTNATGHPGLVVCDTSRASNIDPALCGRDGIPVIDGGRGQLDIEATRPLR